MINDKDKLRCWIVQRRAYGDEFIKTSEVYKWGVDNFSNRAVRNAQDMASKGELLERISKEEAIMLGFSGNEGVWRVKR